MHPSRLLALSFAAAFVAGTLRAQTALEDYRRWLAADGAKLHAALIRGEDAAEATRVAALLTDRHIEPLIVPLADLSKTDLSGQDVIIILRDTQRGPWRDPWGSTAESGALKAAKKPIVGIGEGGLCSFGRFDLPVHGGRTMHSGGTGAVVAQPKHAVVQAPHAIAADPAGVVTVFTRKVAAQPAHRSAYTDVVLPLLTDPAVGRDYAVVLYQHPGFAYWGFEGSFVNLTPAGGDLFENLVRWTVWAKSQTDPARVREGCVERAEPTRKGDHVVDLTLTRADGTVAADTAFSVEVNDPVHKKGWATISEGKTDAAGRATIERLTAGAEAEQYRVSVAGAGVPAAQFQLKDGPPRREMPGRIAPRNGERAPDLELTDIVTGQTVKLSSYRGRVLFIDFWATWCVPCQEPMAHNVKLTAEKKEAWADRAVIVGVSVDVDGAKLKEHVTSRTWTNLPQLWVPSRDGKSVVSAGNLYGFVGIPTAYLIDQAGIIRWRGHPGTFDVAAEIEKLLGAPTANSRPAGPQ